MQGTMYPVSASAVVLRLVIHRLVRERTLHSGEVLSLGLFEGSVLYYALNESPAVGAGCFIGFGSRILLDHMKAPDPINICCSLLGVAVGILLSNVLEQLYGEIAALIREPEEPPLVIIKPRPRSKRRVTFRSPVKRTRSRSGSLSTPESPTARRSIVSNPFLSPWERLQEPIDPRMGLEDEVTELRRRASAAAGETRRLQEEKRWAHSQGNRTREFQLGLDITNWQTLSEQLNRRAAAKIALARNQSLRAKGGDIDVAGLSPSEALILTDSRIKKAKAAGDSFIRVSLAGSNLHVSQHDKQSDHKVQTLLETHLRGRHHSVVQDPSGGNYLVVSVDTDRPSSSASVPISDEWSRALD